MKHTKEKLLFTMINIVGARQDKGIHIINQSSPYLMYEDEVQYRIYHSDGYCFDIEYCYDEDEDKYEYVFYNQFDGFKDINIDQAIELIKKATQ